MSLCLSFVDFIYCKPCKLFCRRASVIQVCHKVCGHTFYDSRKKSCTATYNTVCEECRTIEHCERWFTRCTTLGEHTLSLWRESTHYTACGVHWHVTRCVESSTWRSTQYEARMRRHTENPPRRVDQSSGFSVSPASLCTPRICRHVAFPRVTTMSRKYYLLKYIQVLRQDDLQRGQQVERLFSCSLSLSHTHTRCMSIFFMAALSRCYLHSVLYGYLL